MNRPLARRSRRTAVVSALLALTIPAARAFRPYNGKKFKDARFLATGGLLFNENRALGEVDFKFQSNDPTQTKCTFKGKVQVDGKQKRFKGSLDFNADGSVTIDGLPGQGNEKLTGTYTINGTTVNFQGEKKVTVPGIGEITVKIEGSMSIDSQGEVRIRGTVDAGPISGRFDMNSGKEPPAEK